MTTGSSDPQGILLLGGSGTRLYPITVAVNKHLIAVHDKPLVYYSLATLMLAGVRRVLLVTRPTDAAAFQSLLGDGSQLGMHLDYAEQAEPRGIADGLLVAAAWIDSDSIVLGLGDNLFWGSSLAAHLETARSGGPGAAVLAVKVADTSGLGVVELDGSGKPLTIAEKPAQSTSPYAVPGLYFYDRRALTFAEQLEPSSRGELEITDVNRRYLELGELRVIRLDDSAIWCDAGTPETLQAAADMVRSVEDREGAKIGCVEEIAFRQEWISREQLRDLADRFPNQYGLYLRQLAD